MVRARSLVIGVMVALCCMLAAAVPTGLTEAHAAPSVALAASSAAAGPASPELEIATLDGLDGKRVGVISGGVADKLVTDNLDGTYDFRYFNSPADAIAALRAGKVDGYCSDKPVCQLAVSRYDGIGIVPEPITESDYGLFF